MLEGTLKHLPYHTLLQDAFAERRKKNSSYSLRAFARDLGINPATLSEVLRYRRKLSKQNLVKLAGFFGFGSGDMKKLVSSLPQQAESRLIPEDTIRVVSDWRCFALLSLARTPKCRSDIPWIAKRLGISRVEAISGVKTLERLGLVKRQGRYLIRTSEPLATTSEIPNQSVRRLHSQQLELAQKALERVKLEKREISSMTMAIDPAKLALAKKEITAFRFGMASLLENGNTTDVYVLSVQLFPLTDWEKEP